MFSEYTLKVNVFNSYDQHLYTIYSIQPIENLAAVNILIARESKEQQKVLRVAGQVRATDTVQAEDEMMQKQERDNRQCKEENTWLTF